MQLSSVDLITAADGSVVSTNSALLFFSKDHSTQIDAGTPVCLMSGTWDCVSALRYTAGGVTADAGVGEMTLTDHGFVVDGNMSAVDAASGARVALAGSPFYQSAESGGFVIGHLYDSQGQYWWCEYYAGCLTVWTFTDEGQEITCHVREYTQGGAAYVPVPAVDLGGDLWNATLTQTLNGITPNTVYLSQTLDRTVVYGNLYFGTITTATSSYACAGLYVAGAPARASVYVDFPDSASEWSCGLHWDNTKAVINDFSGKNALRLTFEPVLDHYDAVGHWNVAHSSGYTQYGTYSELTAAQMAKHSLDDFSLDIYRVEGSTFCGNFFGSYVTGSVSGNSLRFDVSISYGQEFVICKLINQRTLIAYAVVYDERTGDFSAWCDVLTKDYCLDGAAPVLVADADFAGIWQMYFGQTFNGTAAVALKGTTLNITEVKGNLFTRTMEQVIGTEVVQKVIRGVIYHADSHGAVGRLVDSTGKVWTLEYNYGIQTVYIIGLNTSQVAEFNGQVICSMRCYSRDGTGTPEESSFELEGKVWKAVSRETMTADGTYTETKDCDVTVTVTKQIYQQAAGTVNDRGYVVTAVGCLYPYGFSAIAQSGEDIAYSHGFYTGGKVYMVAYTNDVETGQYETIITIFEEVVT